MNQNSIRLSGLIAGPMLFLVMMMARPELFSTDQWKVVCMGIWILTWWVTEAVPIAVTALLPVLLLPVLGVRTLKEATAPYGSEVVFLFLGGFMMALALEKWNLHRRIALNIVRITGTRADRIIFGFMLATAALSMWISNTACTVMMLPIALGVIRLVKDANGGGESRGQSMFATSMLLGLAYSASAGGIGTLVGTPPNLVMAGYLRDQLGIDVSFMDWMKVGLPFSLLLLFSIYFLLVKVMFRNGLGSIPAVGDMIRVELKSMGRISQAERRVLIIFIVTALAWIFREFLNQQMPFLSISDTGIAVMAIFFLFIAPDGMGKGGSPLMKWDDTIKLPWGILLLFGGGLSFASALETVGLVEMIGKGVVGMEIGSPFALMLLLTVVALFLTEVMSNVALTTVFVPVVAAIASGLGLSPVYFALPVTIAASCAFMLPMATPPNAIIFSSGQVRIAQMARAGFILNIISALIICLLASLLMGQWEGMTTQR